MTLTNVILGISVVLLFAAAFLALVRIIRGPAAVDRAAGNEVLVSTVVCVLGLQVAFTRDSSTLALLITLAMVGFLGSLSVARFGSAGDDGIVPGSLPPIIEGEELRERDERGRNSQ